MKFRILVIIVTYNGSKWVDKCFNSLRESTIPLEVLVVDNLSKDGTVQKLKDNFPEVEVIESTDNLGFGRANNVGFDKVIDKNYDFAFLLNQDAWIKPDTIENLLKGYNNSELKNIGILSPVHLSGDGKSVDFGFQHYLSPINTQDFLSDLYLNKMQEYYETNFVNAAAWLIPKQTIESIGGFDPVFMLYGEDDDFVNRTKRAGFKLYVVPNAIINHDRPQVRGAENSNYLRNEIFKLSVLQLKKYDYKLHFLYRRMILNKFMLLITYSGNNQNLKKTIEVDKMSIKLFSKIKKDNFISLK